MTRNVRSPPPWLRHRQVSCLTRSSPGVIFNRPTVTGGTLEESYAWTWGVVNNLINASPPGSTIRISLFSWDDWLTQKSARAAVARGVKVQVAFYDGRYDAQTKELRGCTEWYVGVMIQGVQGIVFGAEHG